MRKKLDNKFFGLGVISDNAAKLYGNYESYGGRDFT